MALVLCFLVGVSAFGQTETATLSGVINDPNGRVVPDVEVTATRIETGTAVTTKTNGAGIYFFTGLVPGHYHLMVHKPGFKEIAIKEFELYVQDKLEQNFSLEIGSVSETVTVTGAATLVNTTDAAVSTVVDRNFAENLPLNGRSFQTLFTLTPGVVVTTASFAEPGQFSVSGQRPSANYFTVDGVGANIGITSGLSFNQNAGGSIPGFSVLGGTNNLVSVDGMEEFRIQTSSYAPEFGRTPGAQVSVVTRSGTNQLHGAIFDYLRNDVLDANDWFADRNGLRKAEERQNDFGGVLGGRIVRDRAFFFLSYEGLRLRLPQTGITTVPSLSARQSAPAAVQPFLNAYPIPNGPEILDSMGNPTGQAPFNASYSNPSTLNAVSLRIDQKVNNRLILFGRYNYAPSESLTRRPVGNASALNAKQALKLTTQTLTFGSTWALTNTVTDDFRFNYSRNRGTSNLILDTFGGAVVPPDTLLFPSPFSSQDSSFGFSIFTLQGGLWSLGKNANNLQRQLNLTDGLSLQKGKHALKFGFDYRRLFPVFGPNSYLLQPGFATVSSVIAQKSAFVQILANRGGTLVFNNLGAFAQDTWRLAERATLTYGLRWDVDFSPSTSGGPDLLAVTGFSDPTTLAVAPSGTPIFRTKYYNFGPRIGLAYQLRRTPGHETVIRGGFGVFYDLSTQEVGSALQGGTFPFGARKRLPAGTTFPANPSSFPPPPISATSLASGTLVAFNPNLQLPYTLEWNVALEQSLGGSQALSVSYVGSVGRRLMQTESFFSNPSFSQVNLIGNFATSDYHSMQMRYQRRMAHGLQVLASYALSHSIDTGSGSSGFFTGSQSNFFAGGNNNRGPSDFDIRHSVSAGVTYNFPAPRLNRFISKVLSDWSLDSLILARSALPAELYDSSLFFADFNGDVRPDVIPGVPVYLFGSQFPGGKALNPAAFTDPPIDPNTGFPLRQGTLGRNAERAFHAVQWDFAVHRDFPIHESLKLQFRAEMFNVLNHPNFGNPTGDLSSPFFGQSIQMLNQSLSSQNAGFSSLYQIGGPRSIQFALKLLF